MNILTKQEELHLRSFGEGIELTQNGTSHIVVVGYNALETNLVVEMCYAFYKYALQYEFVTKDDMVNFPSQTSHSQPGIKIWQGISYWTCDKLRNIASTVNNIYFVHSDDLCTKKFTITNMKSRNLYTNSSLASQSFSVSRILTTLCAIKEKFLIIEK